MWSLALIVDTDGIIIILKSYHTAAMLEVGSSKAVMWSVYTRPNPPWTADILLSYVLSSTKHSFIIFLILCSRMDHAGRMDGSESSNVVVIHKQCKFVFPTGSG